MDEVTLNSVREIFQKQGFVTLPTRIDGTTLTFRYYNQNNITYCDVLAYREVNAKGKALSKEVTLLTKTLPQLQLHLIQNLNTFSECVQSQTISFLGKKVHIPINNQGQLIHCCLYLVIIVSKIHNLPITKSPFVSIVTRNNLERYLLTFKENTEPQTPLSTSNFNLLRKSYRFLGLAILLFPFLIGVAGLFYGFGWLSLATLTIFGTAISVLLFILIARDSFHRFQQSMIIPMALRSPLPSLLPQAMVQLTPRPSNSNERQKIPPLQIQ